MARLTGVTALEVRMDSELVVRQLRGEYAVKAANLLQLHKRVQDTIKQFASCSVTHVLREDNAVADTLANAALDEWERTRNAPVADSKPDTGIPTPPK